MKTKDFYFDLPTELIAQYPPAERGKSRLFVLDRASGSFTHDMVENLAVYLPDHSLMVFNDSRVRKSRLDARTDTGGTVEFLLVRRIKERTWECIGSKMKKRTPGSRYSFSDGVTGTIAKRLEETLLLEFDEEIDDTWLDIHGHIPLPPYIKREDSVQDASRYQTVFANSVGSSAAPTAGLHFTEPLFEKIDRCGISRTFVTLHVGLGTFMPVRSESILDHKMHFEEYTVPVDTAKSINDCKTKGRKIVAVGTTSARTLESAFDPESGTVRHGSRETDIFMYPGYRFNVMDCLFTNFHTPESTLLMLVSAFAGKELIFKAYEEAIAEKYRFFSYGDAMLIL